MSLFVKHVTDKQHFLAATVDIMPSPCKASSHAISVKASVENSLTPRDPKRISRGIMQPTDKATADSRSLQSFALDTGILLLAVFILELEMDHPSETNPCTVAPSPQTPILRVFLGRGPAVHRLSGADNPVFKSQAHFSFKIKTIPVSN